LEVDGIHFCHCGDLGHMLSDEQIAHLGKVDVLLTPVGRFMGYRRGDCLGYRE